MDVRVPAYAAQFRERTSLAALTVAIMAAPIAWQVRLEPSEPDDEGGAVGMHPQMVSTPIRTLRGGPQELQGLSRVERSVVTPRALLDALCCLDTTMSANLAADAHGKRLLPGTDRHLAACGLATHPRTWTFGQLGERLTQLPRVFRGTAWAVAMQRECALADTNDLCIAGGSCKCAEACR